MQSILLGFSHVLQDQNVIFVLLKEPVKVLIAFKSPNINLQNLNLIAVALVSCFNWLLLFINQYGRI